MDALKDLFAAIRAVRDCESVHALCLDCWQLAQERGEAEGVAHAKMLLAVVEEHERTRKWMIAMGYAPKPEDGPRQSRGDVEKKRPKVRAPRADQGALFGDTEEGAT